MASVPEGEETAFGVEVPEDVAALFHFLGLKGVSYKDFSGARRRLRAGQRRQQLSRGKSALSEAKANAERATAEAERSARQARQEAREHANEARRAAERHLAEQVVVARAAQDRSLAMAERFRRRAALGRADVARYAAALRGLDDTLTTESSLGARLLAPHAQVVGGESAGAAATLEARDGLQETELVSATGTTRLMTGMEDMSPNRVPLRRAGAWSPVLQEPSDSDGASPGDAQSAQSPSRGTDCDGASSSKSDLDTAKAVEQYARAMPYVRRDELSQGNKENSDAEAGFASIEMSNQPEDARLKVAARELTGAAGATTQRIPSWIESFTTERPNKKVGATETLKSTRERVASRWYALRGVLETSAPEVDAALLRPREEVPPTLVIFSVAGGAGKTSLAAALTRALAAQGERVLLLDMTAHELLPYFFGAQEQRAVTRRVFAPPPGTTDAPIHLVTYRSPHSAGGSADGDLEQRLKLDSKGFSRVVVDRGSASEDDLRTFARLGATVLVPLLPDMNSVISLRAVRRILSQVQDEEVATVQPWYLLTQFDAAQPLHLDIRELLEQELGDRLLPFVVRSSPAVAEALAQGMTVIDYAPGEGISKDLQEVTAWLRMLAEPAREGLGQARWSER